MKIFKKIIWIIKSKYHKNCEYGKCEYCTKDYHNWISKGKPKKWKGI